MKPTPKKKLPRGPVPKKGTTASDPTYSYGRLPKPGVPSSKNPNPPVIPTKPKPPAGTPPANWSKVPHPLKGKTDKKK